MLDELAANAWPAEVQVRLEGWLLRATGGVTRRANSVLTAGPLPADGQWLERVEEFYRGFGLPSRFQVSDGSPNELDALLQERGYADEGYTGVFVARAEEVIERARDGRSFETHADDKVDDRWLDAFMAVEGFAESKKATYRSIYEGIVPLALFVRVEVEGATAGVGMGVTERGWTGLFGIATSSEYRRRGVASHVMKTLAERSVANGAPDLYLQVMDNNCVAISLYEELGFSRLYGYHYRTREPG
jgi:ribosomal protein S18 acetylase RimI-like enzyme